MHTKSDVELLRDYAANNSEAAFGEIVRRYADFVYSAALRQMGSPENPMFEIRIPFGDRLCGKEQHANEYTLRTK